MQIRTRCFAASLELRSFFWHFFEFLAWFLLFFPNKPFFQTQFLSRAQGGHPSSSTTQTYAPGKCSPTFWKPIVTTTESKFGNLRHGGKTKVCVECIVNLINALHQDFNYSLLILFSVSELERRNHHGVTKASILAMLDRSGSAWTDKSNIVVFPCSLNDASVALLWQNSRLLFTLFSDFWVLLDLHVFFDHKLDLISEKPLTRSDLIFSPCGESCAVLEC